MNGAGIAGALAALIAAPTPHADEGTIASLLAISGNVLVSRTFDIASAPEPVRLAPGTRVLATLGASAIVVYDDGRRVQLSEGERLEVGDEHPCRGPLLDRFDRAASTTPVPRQ